MMLIEWFDSRAAVQVGTALADRFAPRKTPTPAAHRENVLQEIFRQVDCTSGLRAMQDTGLLEECLPAWRRIDCLVKRDFYHRYTVDEHTLVALQTIGDLSRSAEPHHRRLQGLLNEAAQPELLRLPRGAGDLR